MVQRARPLDGAEGEPPRERPVPLVELGCRGPEREIRVRVVLEDAEQDAVGRPPGRCYLSPRSQAATSMRRPPSG